MGSVVIDLVAAEQRAGRSLETEPGGAPRDRTLALAGWSLVHGLSALLLEGLVGPDPGSDVESLARAVTGRLGRPLPDRG